MITARLALVLFLVACSESKAKHKDFTETSGQGTSDGSDLRLKWDELGPLPQQFNGSVAHYSQISKDLLLLVDQNGKSYSIDLTRNVFESLTVRSGVPTGNEGTTFIQTSTSSAWAVSSQKLIHLIWDPMGTDLKFTEIAISKLFKEETTVPLEISSPKVSGILLSNDKESIQVMKKDTGFSSKSFNTKLGSAVHTTEQGHLFEVVNSVSIRRFLERNEPLWQAQKVINESLPADAQPRFDVFGASDSLQLSGVAIANGKFWKAGPVAAGSSTQLSGSNNTNNDPNADEKFAKAVSPLLLKYCASCHEGRAPVFVKSDENSKVILKDIVYKEKEKIKFRLNLPENDSRTMPPYAPRPTAEELKTLLSF